METKKSEFNKVFSAWDILVIAFGAMIGWGWVVSTGNWIGTGGVIGAAIGIAIGGIMVFFVGLTYAELTAAMPQCGGEHVFSHKAMGPVGSFICTWAIILGYVSVVCFEACALPTIITYIYPKFLKGYLYTMAGFDIYASWLAVAMAAANITNSNVKTSNVSICTSFPFPESTTTRLSLRCSNLTMAYYSIFCENLYNILNNYFLKTYP